MKKIDILKNEVRNNFEDKTKKIKEGKIECVTFQ